MTRMVINLQALVSMRREIQSLSENLSASIRASDRAIEEASKTWKDDNFIKFQAKFDEDKSQLIPLSKSLKDFDIEYLAKIEVVLREYINSKF